LAVLTTTTETRSARKRQRRWRTLRRLPWLPILLLTPVVVCGLFGPWLYPHDPTAINFLAPRRPPAWLPGGDWSYVLGTDQFGRDLLSRLIEGARVALIVAILGVLGAAVIGIPAGMTAGYFGGFIDNLVMRLVDVKMSIPPILLTILISAAVGGGLWTVIVSIVAVFWADYARVVRGEALVLREQPYVALAQVANCSNLRILARHIFPNLLATCVVLITLQLGRALIIEASITFIGLGIQPPESAWGLLIAEGRAYLATAWWIPTFAGVAITLTVLGANLFGDWLRDVLDPRLRRF